MINNNNVLINPFLARFEAGQEREKKKRKKESKEKINKLLIEKKSLRIL